MEQPQNKKSGNGFIKLGTSSIYTPHGNSFDITDAMLEKIDEDKLKEKKEEDQLS